MPTHNGKAIYKVEAGTHIENLENSVTLGPVSDNDRVGADGIAKLFVVEVGSPVPSNVVRTVVRLEVYSFTSGI